MTTHEPQLAVSALCFVPLVLFPAFLNRKLEKLEVFNWRVWKDDE